MPHFRVNVIWQMMGSDLIEADSDAEARKIASDELTGLPLDQFFVENSFEVDSVTLEAEGTHNHLGAQDGESE